MARAEEYPWVREFFELFKTPWEFYRAGGQYDVLICSANEVEAAGKSAQLVLVFNSKELKLDQELDLKPAIARTDVVLESGGDRIPIYGCCQSFETGGEVLLRVGEEGGAAAVRGKRGLQAVVRVGFDLFQETRYLLTQGQPKANAPIPTLELHIALVRNWIVQSGVRLVEIPPVPEGYRMVACLTHDVDHPAIRRHKFDHTMFGFLRRAMFGSVIGVCRGRMTLGQLGQNWLAVLKLPLVHLGLVEDFWRQTDRYLELERGFASTFFVVPTRNSPGRGVNRNHSSRRATRYEAGDIAGELRNIVDAANEVGLHGIDAWLEADSGRAERAKVSAAAGQSSNGVRMHWLCFNGKSPAALEAAGFDYDSTVGYNECVGYRAGTLQVHRPAGVTRLLELPLHIMDTALFYPDYMDLSRKEAMVLVKRFLGDVARFGGVLTINWHDRSLAPERLWDDFYVQLLAELRREHAWCPTGGRAVDWFRKRRAAVIESVVFEGESVRVKATLPGGSQHLPGLRIRIHRAAAHKSGTGAEFIDVPFNADLDGSIALQN